MAEAKQDQQTIEISYDTKDRDWTKGWKLYYWQFGAGRGQYIRVMFEFCGVEWKEELNNFTNEQWPEQMGAIDKVRGKGLNKTTFAPPIVTHNDSFILSQTGAVVLFLADLFPKYKPSNILQNARAVQV